jgi:hypothetical protein
MRPNLGRSVKRQALILVAFIALVASSCDALGDDLAAVVEGIGIKVSEVEAFATAQADPNAAPAASGTIAGGSARQSLSSLIVYALVADELERRGIALEAGAQAAISQQLEANPQFASLPDVAKEIVTIGEARVAALNDLLIAIDPADADELSDLYERTPSLRTRRCLEAVFVPSDQAEAIDALLEEGQTLGEILLSGETSAQGLVGGATECLAEAQLEGLPPEVLQLINDTAAGESASGTISVPNGEFVVYVSVIEDIEVEAGDAEVQRTLAQIVEGGIGPWIQVMAPDADIEIDPRFGTGFAFVAQAPTVFPPEAPIRPPTLDPFINV